MDFAFEVLLEGFYFLNVVVLGSSVLGLGFGLRRLVVIFLLEIAATDEATDRADADFPGVGAGGDDLLLFSVDIGLSADADSGDIGAKGDSEQARENEGEFHGTVWFALAQNTELKHQLQELKKTLPKRYDQQWWWQNGQWWSEDLRQVMITHRNICHDWQFTIE